MTAHRDPPTGSRWSGMDGGPVSSCIVAAQRSASFGPAGDDDQVHHAGPGGDVAPGRAVHVGGEVPARPDPRELRLDLGDVVGCADQRRAGSPSLTGASLIIGSVLRSGASAAL